MSERFRLLAYYLRGAAGLSASQFLKRHNHPVLLWSQSLDWTEKINFQFETAIIEPGNEQSFGLPAQTESQIAETLVIEIRKQVSTTPAHMICVGRAPNNDIVLLDHTISKFHAYFTKAEAEDSLAIADADSTNGTKLNEQLLIAHQKKSLTNRDLIHLGPSIQMMYLTARGFYDFLRQLHRSGIS